MIAHSYGLTEGFILFAADTAVFWKNTINYLTKIMPLMGTI